MFVDVSKTNMQDVQDVQCPLCFGILRDPVTIKSCHHAFCRDCINSCLSHDSECPKCHIPVDISQMEPNLAVKELVGKLRVRCQNSECHDQNIVLDRLEAHLRNDCLFAPVVCPWGCSESNLTRQDLPDHKSKCPSAKSLLLLPSTDHGLPTSCIPLARDCSPVLTQWVAEAAKSPSPVFSPLWRGSADGFGLEQFRARCCHGKGATLIIILTTAGHTFGVYTSVGWEERKRGKVADPRLFLFSLDMRARFVQANPMTGTTWMEGEVGPQFGTDVYTILHIRQNCNTSKQNYAALHGLEHSAKLCNFALLAGSSLFTVREIEIYEVRLS